MKLTKLLMLVLISSFIGLVSCDEEASSPVSTSGDPTIQDYSPLSIGSWWKYDRYETDSDGNKIGIDYTDSTFVSGIKTIFDHEAYEIITISTDEYGEEIDTTYSRYDGNKIMTVFSGFEEIPDIDIKWFVSADLDNSSWTIFDDTFDMSVEGIDMNLDILMTGSKGSESTYDYMGQSYKSIAFTYNADIEITGEYMEQQFTQSSLISSTIIHAAGIGIVKENEREFLENMGEETKIYTESILTAYHIAD